MLLLASYLMVFDDVFSVMSSGVYGLACGN